MKKILLIAFLVVAAGATVVAQKYAYVDTDYILNKIPAYAEAQSKLDEISKQFQSELEKRHAEIEKMYKDFQSESALLSADMKKKREDLIISKEKEYKALQRQYFGPEGELYQKREALVKPIQDEIYNAIQSLASQGGYAVIFDKAAGTTMLYTDSRYDLSDLVLQKLGYNN